jgi:Na+/H+ antiporter NhaD/arsenite permease-like protein
MWSLTDILHAGEDEREELMAPAALKKIDTSGVLFFLGILLSVGALDSSGILKGLATFLDQTFPSTEVVAVLIGIVSALIDNVPLVAATMGMYNLADVPMDSELWQLIAFCAGTGGSLLVIGSAAGVALMGLEKVILKCITSTFPCHFCRLYRVREWLTRIHCMVSKIPLGRNSSLCFELFVNQSWLLRTSF